MPSVLEYRRRPHPDHAYDGLPCIAHAVRVPLIEVRAVAGVQDELLPANRHFEGAAQDVPEALPFPMDRGRYQAGRYGQPERFHLALGMPTAQALVDHRRFQVDPVVLVGPADDLPRRGNGDEVVDVDMQRLGDGLQGQQRRVRKIPLDLGEERYGEARTIGEALQGEPQAASSVTNRGADAEPRCFIRRRLCGRHRYELWSLLISQRVPTLWNSSVVIPDTSAPASG